MSKHRYTIKNCPALRGWVCNELFIKQDIMIDCKDCTDCVMKQIVEKCKLFQNNYLVNDGVQLLTTNILNSLDIQEVE